MPLFNPIMMVLQFQNTTIDCFKHSFASRGAETIAYCKKRSVDDARVHIAREFVPCEYFGSMSSSPARATEFPEHGIGPQVDFVASVTVKLIDKMPQARIKRFHQLHMFYSL